MGSRRGSISSHGDEENGGTTAVPSVAPVRIGSEEKEKAVDRVQFIKDCWEAFKREQNAEITRLLAAGIVDDDELRVYRAAPSLHDQYVLRPFLSFSLLCAASTFLCRLTLVNPSIRQVS